MELSLTKLLLIALVVFAIFGAGKLPQAMGELSRGIRAFRDGMKGEGTSQDGNPPQSS